MSHDKTLDNLLELDKERFVIDEHLGLWVKFEVKRTVPSKNRPHGIKYSITLHDRSNARIMGFDNAHAIEYVSKKNISSKKAYDHWHRNEKDVGRPYDYKNAGKLIEDFWHEVDNVLKRLRESK